MGSIVQSKIDDIFREYSGKEKLQVRVEISIHYVIKDGWTPLPGTKDESKSDISCSEYGAHNFVLTPGGSK